MKFFSLAVALAGIFFAGCDDDDDPVQLTVKADVFTVQVLDGELTKTATMYYVYSNKELKSVSVKTPDTTPKTITLSAATADKMQFVYKPVSADYSNVVPKAGDYEFTVTDKDNKVITIKDKLANVTLPLVGITETSFASKKLTVKWTSVAGAENMDVKLFDSSNKLLFVRNALSPTTVNLTFGSADTGWTSATKAVNGQNYTVSVEAVKYETNTVASEKKYNIEMISGAKKDITWIE